jgi:hypothetical protein
MALSHYGSNYHATNFYSTGYYSPEIEIVEIDTGRGGLGNVESLHEIDYARRKREEQEIVEVAIALITSGVLDELI